MKLCECGCGKQTSIIKFSDASKNLVAGQPRRFLKGHSRRGVKPTLEPIAQKMERLTQKTGGCWLWLGYRNRAGYGALTHDNVKWLAHRLSYSLAHKVTIPKGVVVRHKCDNPACVNPEHLELGEQLDNVRDMAFRKRENFFGRKNHEQVGERNPVAKLTAAQVQEIRTRRAQGELLSSLAAEFGISKSYVGNLAAGRKWKHLER